MAAREKTLTNRTVVGIVRRCWRGSLTRCGLGWRLLRCAMTLERRSVVTTAIMARGLSFPATARMTAEPGVLMNPTGMTSDMQPTANIATQQGKQGDKGRQLPAEKHDSRSGEL